MASASTVSAVDAVAADRGRRGAGGFGTSMPEIAMVTSARALRGSGSSGLGSTPTSIPMSTEQPGAE